MAVKAMPVDYIMERKYGYLERETRFVIMDLETGEILDDAQGYGYKTAVKAHRAYGWKQSHRT